MIPYDPVKHSGKVVIYLWAKWCHPCTKQRPILERCEKHLKGVTFMSHDCSTLSLSIVIGKHRLDSMTLPSIYIFNDCELMSFRRPDGKCRDYITGLHTSVRDIVKIIKNIYKQNGVKIE